MFTGKIFEPKDTMTPAKYTAVTAYKITNIRSLFEFFAQSQSPAGNTAAVMWRSKKKETQVVG
jgi:hypothetical protein